MTTKSHPLLLILPLILLANSALAAVAPAPAQDVQMTYQDMKKTLGIVPQFVKKFPVAALPSVWEEMKNFYFNPNTALSRKEKDLIALGTDGQIPCKYCSYFDTESAKVDGASPQQIAEAVAMAAVTRHWSTVLNGMQLDEMVFRKETDQIMNYVKLKMKMASDMSTSISGERQAGMVLPVITTPEDAYTDIEKTLGIVPTFLRNFPREGIVGAWKEMKSVQLSSTTQLTAKEKELIGLAVAAQIPCRYCTYFHKQAALMNGATEREINEAVAVSAITAHWSTVLNGLQIDESSFKRDTDQIMDHLRKNPLPIKQLGGQVAPSDDSSQ